MNKYQSNIKIQAYLFNQTTKYSSIYISDSYQPRQFKYAYPIQLLNLTYQQNIHPYCHQIIYFPMIVNNSTISYQQNQEQNPSIKYKLSESSRINYLKVAYRCAKTKKLYNYCEQALIKQCSTPVQCKKQFKISCTKSKGKSSYQLYKQKQKQVKQKLQDIHTLQNPKSNIDHFYCTIKAKDSRMQKRLKKNMENTNQLGSIYSLRSQIHYRDQLNLSKQIIIRNARQISTQSSPRKQFSLRKYSLDVCMSPIAKLRQKKNISNPITLINPATYRPWSPANCLEGSQLHFSNI